MAAEMKVPDAFSKAVTALVIAALMKRNTEMEGYAYFSSNKGCPADEFPDVAEEVSESLAAMLEPVAYGVLTSWDGTDKAEVRDIRFTSDEAEGVAYHAQNKIPKGFPVTVTAVPLYRIKESK